MTVVDALNSAAPAYQPGSNAAGNPQPGSGNSAVSAAAAAAAAGVMSPASGQASSSQPGNLPMALKAKDEILTSLHLIKDIRRLEKYQRDFFLKVKPV